jgi:hypothetical protein
MIVVMLNVVVLSVVAPGQLVQKGENLTLAKLKFLVTDGSAISNGRDPKSCLGRVFNSKLGHIATLLSKCMASMQALLELKTRPRGCPVS